MAPNKSEDQLSIGPGAVTMKQYTDRTTSTAGGDQLSTGAVARRLGHVDHYVSTYHKMMGSTQMAVMSSLKSKWPVSVEDLHSAAKVLQERHPLLRSRIVLHPIEDLKLGACNYGKIMVVDQPLAARPIDISPVTYKNWAEAMEVEIGNQFDEAAGPLWRVKIVTFAAQDSPDDRSIVSKAASGSTDSNYPFQVNVLWVTHHAISDGVSHMSLLKGLLAILRQGPDARSWDAGILGGPGPVPPQIDDLIGQASPEAAGEHSGLSALNPGGVRREAEDVAIDSLRFRIHPVNLDNLDLTELKSRCKREGTTVHSALQAATMIAACHHILHRNVSHLPGTELEAEETTTVNWFGPANIRKYVNPVVDLDNVSLNVSAYEGKTAVSGSDGFWELARDFKKDLNSFMDKGVWRLPHNIVTQKGFLSVEEAEAMYGRATVEAKIFAKPTFHWSTSLSNIGHFVFDEAGNSTVRISQLNFAANPVGLDIAFYANCVSYDQSMSLDLAYVEPHMSRHSVQAFAQVFVAELTQAIAG